MCVCGGGGCGVCVGADLLPCPYPPKVPPRDQRLATRSRCGVGWGLDVKYLDNHTNRPKQVRGGGF